MVGNMDDRIRQVLKAGTVIPAHPLALHANRKLDERRQRALTRYYAAAGAGGVAVGVHTTQFAIREPQIGLFEPVLGLAAEEMDRAARACRRDQRQDRASGARSAPAVRLEIPRRSCEFGRGKGFAWRSTHPSLPRDCRHFAGYRLLPAAGGRGPGAFLQILAAIFRD